MTANDFVPEDFMLLNEKPEQVVIQKQSQSYWQDVWLRFKRNRKALWSFYILCGLSTFSLLGPVFWQVDPATQDSTQISIAPTLMNSALIVDELKADPSVTLLLRGLPHAEDVWLLGQANTELVKIAWKGNLEAVSYEIFRHELKPSGEYDLGLPLGETDGETYYEDRLKLEGIPYFYSVLARNQNKQVISLHTIKADVRRALMLDTAKAKVDEGSLKLQPGEKISVGEMITLPIHPMGTDGFGRDLMARVMLGGQTSLLIGFFASIFFVFIGFIYGAVSGYLGGAIDNLMMRFADFVVALPFLLFMILLRVAFGVGPGESGIVAMIISLVLLSWPTSARLVRGQVLQLKQQAFIQSAKMNGANLSYILIQHLLPNVLGVILVSLSFAIPSVILTEAFLSFIGLGVVPPTPSWGAMCNEGIKTFLFHPHELAFPAVFISVTVLAFNLFGDGLREAFDVKLKD